MALARRLARFNRRVVNPPIRSFAGKVPPLAVVRHRGRKSGREYRTPVVAVAVEGGYAITLPYGAEADWVRNVLVAGGCVLERRGRRIELTGARLIGEEGYELLPVALRPILRLLRLRRLVTLTTSDGAHADGRT